MSAMGHKKTAQRRRSKGEKKVQDWNGSGATNALKYLKEPCAGKKERDGCRVPLFCLVRGCSRETRITHELALSQFYTRHVPSKRVVKSTRVLQAPPRLLSLPFRHFVSTHTCLDPVFDSILIKHKHFA